MQKQKSIVRHPRKRLVGQKPLNHRYQTSHPITNNKQKSKSFKIKAPRKSSQVDVYEADDNAKDESRILGINSASNRLDNLETLELDDDVKINEDEEITEDEAFDEDDEFKYGDFFAENSSHYSPPVSNKSNSTGQNIEQKEIKYKPLNLDEEGSDLEAEEQEGYEEEIPESDEETQVSDSDEEANTNLINLVSSLSRAKQPASSSNEDTRALKKLKTNIEVTTEPYEESEFNFRGTGNTTSNQLQIADLLAPLKDTTKFGSLKKRISEFESDQKYSHAFAAPLPKILQDRQARKAAYNQAKTEISKWQSFVKANQQADSLSFPVDETALPILTNNALSEKFEPGKTDLEKEVQEILNASDLSEKKLKEVETLQMEKVSMEEIIKRRKELAKMRSLLFFHEQKQKKIAKIKSKTYRKIRKKEALKRSAVEDFGINDLMTLDPELGRQKMEEQELSRIKERMTLRHKNSGKWARAMLGKRDAGTETRQALMGQLQQHETLKRKMSGIDSDESSDDDEAPGNCNDQMNDQEHDANVKATALDSLSKLAKEIQNESNIPKKGVWGMKFMQNEYKRQQEQATKDVEAAMKELSGNGHVNDDGGDEHVDAQGERHVDGEGDRHVDDEGDTHVNDDADGDQHFNDDANDDMHTNASLVQLKKGGSALKESISTGVLPRTSVQVADISAFPPPDLAQTADMSELSRSDIMQMAFADDNCIEEFQEEKRLAQEGDVQTEEDLTLPGWGLWGGVGIEPKKNLVVRKPRPSASVDPRKRKDAKLRHVIINEKRVKKAAKFMLPQLPHNFDNAEQYEHTIRMPLGGEWNAPSVYLSSIQPRIKTKLGAVIKPPKLPKKVAK